MDVGSIIEELKLLPEVKLQILALAWEVIGEDGTVDYEKLVSLAREQDQAVKQARAYARSTEEAVNCLRELARSTP